ncbi:biotin transporter BioY [Ectobacillus antri]|jgi:biotin transport system substrate-specific component|uniref:Biotin transporter n=1 Tax=Ectobacillus antri TaxID=2486280 RepID=A0ABT6H7P4_9BACI|nr:biotin transporter BioY [Ectobacillus antri]MDG4658265.1 biotin transporter BioY [Ectobacillus antri]MDG5755354.1 biotin transporter BioY [Ectobacillus antri]
MRKFRTLDLTLAAMFVALMAIGANITSWAPFLQVAGIPLSMQPFFAILAGLLLGSRVGALSMTVYMLVGIAGAPVFAQFSAGIDTVLGMSGGFILSYIVVAYVTGKIVESKVIPTFSTFLISSLVGIALIYVIGTNYMYAAANVWLEADMEYATAWKIMMWFMVKDLAFTILGAVIAPRIYRAITSSGTAYSRTA